MIDIYADGADLNGILEQAKNPLVKGFTTNPTLMRQAGIEDYMMFACSAIEKLKELRPDTNISLEVFADDWAGMTDQAYKLHNLGLRYKYDVFVKIPIMTTNGKPTYELIKALSDSGVNVNVTAVFTDVQEHNVCYALCNTPAKAILSVFAGRIADTQTDPRYIIEDIKHYRNSIAPKVKLLWASSREVFNVVQATLCDCDIITMTNDQIKKLSLRHKDLDEYSLETCKMFYNDAKASGYTL